MARRGVQSAVRSANCSMSDAGPLQFSQLAASDTAEVFLLWSDFETVKLTNWAHTPTLDECAERMRKVMDHYGQEARHFGPCTIRFASGRFVGLVGADLFDADRDEYEVWYVLRRDEWGKGVATRAVAELLRRMTESGRVRRAMATAVTSNVASWRLLERQGFSRERTIAGGFLKHGLALDLYQYGREIAPPG
jgi:RimJ/RimL family protein N-acetyltransferase